MKKLKITITGQQQKDRACELVQVLSLSPPKQVTIEEAKTSRSTAQNSLMWLWNTEYGAEIGLTKEEAHIQFKRKYLLPIMERDHENFDGFDDLIEAIRNVYRLGDREKAEKMINVVAREASTSRLSVEQMTEYLNDIEAGCRNENIFLSHPDDYGRAMG